MHNARSTVFSSLFVMSKNCQIFETYSSTPEQYIDFGGFIELTSIGAQPVSYILDTYCIWLGICRQINIHTAAAPISCAYAEAIHTWGMYSREL